MATWVTGGLLLLAVVGAVVKLVRDKRNGKGCCGGNCSHCKGCR
ncbi:MAG: FeoB-associated Cys-rich membrane protein [Aristaeellaceae bacterium]